MSNYHNTSSSSAVNVENGGLGIVGFDSGVNKSLVAFTLIKVSDDDTDLTFTIFALSSYGAKSSDDDSALIQGLYLLISSNNAS